jgi:nucleoside-diphosphate-sugar epimerase
MTAQKQKHILVTGATGLVGSYLLRYLLKEGYTNVRACRRPESSMALVTSVQNRVEWMECDILNIDELEDAMDGVHQIYHCAALVSYDLKDKDALYKINKEGTENVVNMALICQVEKLVHVSSVATIGRDLKGSLITEKTKWERNEMVTHYAKSKYLAEMEAWRGAAEGLNVVVVNPSTILGSGFWDKGTSRFFELAWHSFSWYSKGSAGFVDVRDVAQLMIKAMETAESGERFILSGENLPYKELMAQIARHLDRPAASRKMQDWMQGGLWRWEWFVAWLNGSKPYITKEVAKKVSILYAYDNSKSVEAFTHTYQAISETIASVAGQFKEAAADNFSVRVMPLV